jgi:peroxiredoxin
MFFNPQCGNCEQMAPALAALPFDNGITPVVITTGDVGQNRKFMKKYGIRCPVLRQEGMEIASLYGTGGTPTGYLIDEEGRIASELAVGAEALLMVASAAGKLLAMPATAGNGIPRR